MNPPTSRRALRLCFLLTLVATTALLTTVAASPASACGGFFCNAGTQSPIYQAGERVVFAPGPEGDGVTMHIEVSYQGEPTEFGWLLPIEPPRDAAGQVLALDDILRVSTTTLFDQLAAATIPTWSVNRRFEADACPLPQWADATAGDFFASGDTTTTSVGADTGSSMQPPPVVVLQQAEVGPYDAVLLQATDADALYVWLEDNGYQQDPAARPLLAEYIGKGFVFLGLRLQSGRSTGDLRPVELHLGETFACVPLRLTSIAATDDMPMLVWVLGQARAVPKNFIHAAVNPLALSWPGAANYPTVVTDAINEIEGRAFVTEYAGDTPLMAQAFDNAGLQARRDELEAAESLSELVVAVNRLGGVDDLELLPILQAQVPMPEGLRGYPYGNCYYDPSWMEPVEGDDVDPWGWRQPCPQSDAEHLTTEGEFYTYLPWWIDELERRETPLAVEVETLRAAVLAGYIEPRERIQAMFDENPWITRFYTTISGHEMTRDPIFAFNPDLPPVSRTHTLEAVVRGSCDDYWLDATYEHGREVRFECQASMCNDRNTLPPLSNVPVLLQAEILDESGAARPFDPLAATTVDALLDLAVPGQSTIPANFELPPPPARDNSTLVVGRGGGSTVTGHPLGDGDGGCGCQVSRTAPLSRGLGFVFGLLVLGCLAALRRAGHR